MRTRSPGVYVILRTLLATCLLIPLNGCMSAYLLGTSAEVLSETKRDRYLSVSLRFQVEDVEVWFRQSIACRHDVQFDEESGWRGQWRQEDHALYQEAGGVLWRVTGFSCIGAEQRDPLRVHFLEKIAADGRVSYVSVHPFGDARLLDLQVDFSVTRLFPLAQAPPGVTKRDASHLPTPVLLERIELARQPVPFRHMKEPFLLIPETEEGYEFNRFAKGVTDLERVQGGVPGVGCGQAAYDELRGRGALQVLGAAQLAQVHAVRAVRVSHQILHQERLRWQLTESGESPQEIPTARRGDCQRLQWRGGEYPFYPEPWVQFYDPQDQTLFRFRSLQDHPGSMFSLLASAREVPRCMGRVAEQSEEVRALFATAMDLGALEWVETRAGGQCWRARGEPLEPERWPGCMVRDSDVRCEAFQRWLARTRDAR